MTTAEKRSSLQGRNPNSLIALAIVAVISSPLGAQGEPEKVTQEYAHFQAAQKILTAHCVKCHGPDNQESGLRLDSPKAILIGGDFGPAVVRQKSLESELVKRVSSKNTNEVMPPEGPRLTSEEVAQLAAWIDAGVPWPTSKHSGDEELDSTDEDPRMKHWAWQEMNRPSVPVGVTALRDEADIEPEQNEIDYFVRAKLAVEKLSPSAPADKRTLIRRLYFDLIGLPPTPEEINAFVADASPEAYETLVDELLASSHYGERWARHWLDVVHYGDTHGYDKDKPRNNAWPYRDFVIRSLNEDKPYARFVQEQIAGDTLFPGTRDGIEALGFIAAGPWDYIGHAEVPETKIDGKMARHLDRDDMVANTMGTFCSVTVHCAQCHNHKFDPISQRDYYSLQAVFASLDRTDRQYFPDPAIQTRFEELQNQQVSLERDLAAIEEPLKIKAGEAYTAISRKIDGASKAKAAKQGNEAPDFGYHSAISQVQDTMKWVQVDLGKQVEIASVTLLPCFDDFNNIGAGFGFPVRFKVEASDDPEFEIGVTQLWRRHDETFMNDFKNPGLTAFITGGAKDDGISGRYVRVTATKLAPRQNDFIFALAELKVIDLQGDNVANGKPVTALDSIEAPPRWRKANLTDGLAPVTPTADEKHDLVQERDALLLSYADDATQAKRSALIASKSKVDAELKQLPAPSLVYAGGIHTGSGNFIGTGANGGKPRPIFFLSRGQVTQPKDEMTAGTISAFSFAPGHFPVAADAAESDRRAALARWITDANNPLTWRSIVNRVWQYHFGRGLTDTPNDFGLNGSEPSHPELLDWLATEFRDNGGSLKTLHKQIVMSATYRQSTKSNAAADAERIDTNNSLLWRQNRRKLEAEAVRDAVLAVSGKLDLSAGGPGWQDFVIEHPAHSPHYEYNLADPADPKTWRRGVYRFIVRSQTQPWMTSLDCADPSIRVDKRNESLSALQALALLNNGFMLTQSIHFAERVQRERPDLDGQVARAYSLALGHEPNESDHDKLIRFAKTHGMPSLCRVLLNLNEFSFVD